MKQTVRIHLIVLGISILTGLFFWFIHGYFELKYFHQNLSFLVLTGPDTLFESLISRVSPQALLVRISFMAACLVSGFAVAVFLSIEKRTESALNASQKRLQLSLEINHASVFEYNLATGTIMMTPELFEFLGYGEREIPETFEQLSDFIHPDDQAGVMAALDRHLRGDTDEYYTECRMRKKSGAWCWVDGVGELVRQDIAADSVRLIGISRDISKRKETEQLLEEQERKIKDFVHNVPIAFGYVDNDTGAIYYVNNQFSRLFGYTLQDFPDIEKWWELAYPEEKYRTWVIDNWNKSLESGLENNGGIAPEVYRVTCKNGEAKDIIISGLNINNNFFVSFIDVTEQKKAERELRASEEKFSVAFKSGSYAMAITRIKDGSFIDFNTTFSSVGGYSDEEIRANSSLVLNMWVNEDDRNTVISDLQNGIPVENREILFRRRNNEVFIGLYSSEIISIDNEPCMLSSINDVSKLKKAEQALIDSEERMRTIFASAPLGIALGEARTGKFVEVNQRFTEITGRNFEELVGIDWMAISHPEDIPEDLSHMDQLISGEINSFHMEKRYIRPDGSIVWVDMTVSRFTFDGKGALRHLCMVSDITEKKLAVDGIIKLNKELEQKVIERTRQLEQKYIEVERLNKLFVGRELRMVELKKKLEEADS